MSEYNEFTYRNEEERDFLEERAIYVVIDRLIKEIKEKDKVINHKDKGEIFGHKIAFVINKKLIPPAMSDDYVILKEASERITLDTITINEVKLELPYNLRKFSFKERVKIFFKGYL